MLLRVVRPPAIRRRPRRVLGLADLDPAFGTDRLAFARAILDDTPVPTPLDDAVGNMRTIEAVLTSARANAWV